MLRPQQALKVAPGVLVIGHLNLGDETVESQSHRRIADPVAGGQFFQGSRGQHQALDEGQILIAEVINPSGGGASSRRHKVKVYIYYIHNKDKVNIVFIHSGGRRLKRNSRR